MILITDKSLVFSIVRFTDYNFNRCTISWPIAFKLDTLIPFKYFFFLLPTGYFIIFPIAVGYNSLLILPDLINLTDRAYINLIQASKELVLNKPDNSYWIGKGVSWLIVWYVICTLIRFHLDLMWLAIMLSDWFPSQWVVPSQADTELWGHRVRFARWPNELFGHMTKPIILFISQLLFFFCYQTKQIRLGLHTNFQQIGTVNLEWLQC